MTGQTQDAGWTLEKLKLLERVVANEVEVMAMVKDSQDARDVAVFALAEDIVEVCALCRMLLSKSDNLDLNIAKPCWN